MRIPKLKALNERRQPISAFGGYDKRAVIEDGAWSDMENLSLDEYPTMKVREKHGTLTGLSGSGPVTGIFEANGKLGYTRYVSSGTPAADHGTITYTDAGGTVRTVDLGLDDSLKKFVRMGAYVIVQPDMAWVNTADLTSVPEHGNLAEVKYTLEYTTAGDITATAVDEDGSPLLYTSSSTEPADPEIGDLWYSTGTKDLLRYYEDGWSAYTGQTYVKLSWDSYTGSFDFEKGLSIKIDISDAHGSYIGTKLVDGYYKLIDVGEDSGHPFIIIEHPFLAGTISSYDTIILSWGLPKMDFMIESGNRLWGCYYGKVNKVVEGVARNVTVNEIYASALGSFKEWYQDLGVSTDAYTASVGSDGPFTGAVSYQGTPIFFKAKVMHKVYGSYPAQYQIQTTECRGVQEGCSQSLAIVNNALYYKSPEGFCVYDGSLPSLISAPLGNERYSGAVAGGHNGKYFVTANNGASWVVLIYDTRLGAWNRAEAAQDLLWTPHGGDMLYVTGGSDNYIHTWYGTGAKDSTPVSWKAVTGYLGLSYQDGSYSYTDIDRKYIARLLLRVRLDVGSLIAIEVSYDDKEWIMISRIAGYNLESFSLPVPLRRCDHFRLRLSGTGGAQIFSLTKIMQGGSDK